MGYVILTIKQRCGTITNKTERIIKRMKKFHQKILTMLSQNTPLLVFALVCGAAYFMIILRFIMFYTSHVGLAALFTFPAVICGGAFIVIKMIRHGFETDKGHGGSAVLMLFYMNAWIIIIALLMLITLLMGIEII